MPVTTAMIVAGGRGTRLQPLTHDTPKPLLEFFGAPFLLGVIGRLAEAGVTRVFLVVGADTTPFDGLAKQAADLGVTVTSVPEPSPLDTAGGVAVAAREVDEPFFVLNGDILTDIDFAAMAAAFETARPDAMISLKRVADTSAFGVCVREDTRIVDFVEKPAPGTLPGQDAINAGTYILAADALDGFADGKLSFEYDVFPSILKRGGHLEGFVWEGEWADLGTPDRWHAGHAIILDGRMQWPTLSSIPQRADGVWVSPQATVDAEAALVAPVVVFDGASVSAGSTCGPYSAIGPGATVGANTTARHAIVGRDATLGADLELEWLITGPRAEVRSGARLAGHNVIGADTTVEQTDIVEPQARVPEPKG